MERTRTVKRGYVVFGESITLRWGVELSWGNRALGTGKAGCGVRLAAVAAGFAGRAVVFFTLPAKVAPAILMHGRICLNWKPVSLFYHEFLLLHQRDPYDWNARHEAVKKRNRTVKPEYVMIGDSITHHWGGEPSGDGKNTGAGSWEKLFRPHTATNMGFGFDYVDNAYYRVQNGELDGISPRVIIVLLGTNNLGHRKDTPQACADNIRAFVRLVRRKCPSSKILLLGVLPRKEPGGTGEADEQAAGGAA